MIGIGIERELDDYGLACAEQLDPAYARQRLIVAVARLVLQELQLAARSGHIANQQARWREMAEN